MATTQLISDFQLAFVSRNASQLGQCFNPFADQYRTQAFFNFTNVVSAPVDIRRALTSSHSVAGFKLPKQELNTFIDVFVSYWAALGELNAVNKYRGGASGGWSRVFGAWRDLANTVIRGYTVGGLEAWTVPCLYQVGKSLRFFAMEADADDRANEDADGQDFQDDMIIDGGKNANLEEAARMLTRMFTLCLQDRYLNRLWERGAFTVLTSVSPLNGTGRRWTILANGAYTPLSLSRSKHISRYDTTATISDNSLGFARH